MTIGIPQKLPNEEVPEFCARATKENPRLGIALRLQVVLLTEDKEGPCRLDYHVLFVDLDDDEDLHETQEAVNKIRREFPTDQWMFWLNGGIATHIEGIKTN